MLLRITSLLGNALEAPFAEKIHALEHRGCVDYLTVHGGDLARKRLRLVTARGDECAIALPRDVALEHGAILLLEADRAIVVRLEELPSLVFEARDRASALRLGFLAGHHHWRTQFDGNRIRVSVEHPRAFYLDRLRHHLDDETGIVVEESGE